MLWLYNDYSNEFTFYQIYDNLIEGIVYESNNTIIYSLIKSNINIDMQKNINIPISKDIFNFDIKIKDNLIRFENNQTNVINTFIFEMNFIETDTPKFKYTYKRVKNTMLPNMSNELYDFVGTFEFQIERIKQNYLFVKEHNLLTNELKQYNITENLK
jgi:hypothetical protein